MCKKIGFFFLIAVFFQNALSAQSLMHSFGANISVLYGKITSPSSSASFAVSQTNLSYFPRYNFIENENSSVSVGLPVGVGIGIASNTYGGDAGVLFAYDIPVVVDYNIGCKSTMENERNFGGYVGAGFGYYKVNISKSVYSDFNGSTYGPIVRGGVRFSSSKEGWNGHGISVGVFYKKGLEKDKLNTVGFNVFFDL